MIFTFGHSTLSIEDASEKLRPIEYLIDIRSHPTSRWEQWQKERLEQWVSLYYEWLPGLGGWRTEHYETWHKVIQTYGVDLAAYSKGKFPKQRIGVQKPDQTVDRPSWTNQGLWDYQFFTMLPEFNQAALYLVENFGDWGQPNAAIMCCEVLWWKCHRSIVADYLHFMGQEVVHMQPKYTEHADAIGNRIERYHPDVLDAWKQVKARDW